MQRIKDITKIKLLKGNVLLKIYEDTPSKIITADGTTPKHNISYAEVVVTSEDSDLKVGDIVLDFASSPGFDWNGEKYCLVLRMSILIAISADNFDKTKKPVKQLVS